MGKTPASCNASRQAQTTDVELAGGALLAVPRAIALPVEGVRTAGLLHAPQRARCRQDQTLGSDGVALPTGQGPPTGQDGKGLPRGRGKEALK